MIHLWRHFFLGLYLLLRALPAPALPNGYEIIAQDPVYDFTFYQDTADGMPPSPFTIKSFLGKAVLLHFWSFACPPCQPELSSLNAFASRLSTEDVAVLCINLDQKSAGQVANFHAEKQLYALTPYTKPSMTRPKIRGLPTTMIINKEGALVGRFEGPANWQDPAMKRLVDRLVRAENQAPWASRLKSFFDQMKNMIFAHAAESTKMDRQVQTVTQGKPKMSTTMHTSLLILGSGPAGYTAAIYAARSNLKPILIMGMEPGGQLMITTDVENYPGFANPVQGPWLMEQMKLQAQNVGTVLVQDHINKVDLSHRPFTCYGDQGTYTCDSLIIATGAQARWLQLDSETKFRGYGVSGCATCDAPFFKGKTVAVVGGGNTAVEEALHLTRYCSKVYLVHRRDQLRADKISQERLFKHEKIEVIWDSVVEEVTGTENPKSVTGVRLKNLKTNKETNLPIDGLFVAIGHTPRTELFKDQLQLDAAGYILTQGGPTQTSVAGVFAAGDVQDKVYRQAVTAAGLGCMAATDAEHYLDTLETSKATLRQATQK